MDFSFTDEQTMLRDSVGRYLEKNYDFDRRKTIVSQGASKEVWRDFADQGLLALPFPEDVGGFGGTIVDVVSVAELFGEHLVVEPYVSSILLAGNALARSGRTQHHRSLVSRVVAGACLAAFAHEEGAGLADPTLVSLRAVASGDRYRLDGEKRYVLGSAQAEVFVVSTRIDGAPGDTRGLALILLPSDQVGVHVTPFQTVDGRAAAHIRFDGVEVPADAILSADAHAVIADVIRDATIALCAEGVGAMGALLSMTADYASTRRQFGVPIGSFQAVAHRLADMKIAYAKARSTLLYTAALAEAGRATPRDISILKGQVGRLGISLAEAAVQTHGGIGMTDELAVGHYLKRLLAIDAMFGASDYHFRLVGKRALEVAA